MTRRVRPGHETGAPIATKLVDGGAAPASRRPWITPELSCNSTLTEVTQVGSPVPLSLLFLQASNQCFDSHGRPASCT